MGGLFSTTYDLEKVSHNIKSLNKKKQYSNVTHEIKTTESGNNTFSKSDIEIIGEINSVKKEDGKTVRIDESKTEVFEHVEVQEEPVPKISEEERKLQEDLMVAMVRGQIQPRPSISNVDDVNAKQEDKYIVENATSPPSTNDINEISVVKDENTLDQPQKSVTDKAEVELNLSTENRTCIHITQEQTGGTHSINADPTDKAISEITVEISKLTIELEDSSQSNATKNRNEEVLETKPEETSEQGILQEIISIENETRTFNEKATNDTTQAEYEVLQQELIKCMIKLDNIWSNNDEIRSERKRVIKMIQKSLDNLEEKIEGDKTTTQLNLEENITTVTDKSMLDEIQGTITVGVAAVNQDEIQETDNKNLKEREKQPEEVRDNLCIVQIEKSEAHKTEKSVEKKAEIEVYEQVGRKLSVEEAKEKVVASVQIERKEIPKEETTEDDTVKLEEGKEKIEIKEMSNEETTDDDKVKAEEGKEKIERKEMSKEETTDDDKVKEKIERKGMSKEETTDCNTVNAEEENVQRERKEILKEEIRENVKVKGEEYETNVLIEEKKENLETIKDEPAKEKSETDKKSEKSENEDTVLQEIKNIENVVKSLKEEVINFSNTTKDKEYEALHEALVKNIISLDDISSNKEEIRSERKRVIKISQQCLQNLERKIETVKKVDGSESE